MPDSGPKPAGYTVEVTLRKVSLEEVSILSWGSSPVPADDDDEAMVMGSMIATMMLMKALGYEQGLKEEGGSPRHPFVLPDGAVVSLRPREG